MKTETDKGVTLASGRFYLFSLIVLTLLLCYLSYLIINPFLIPIAWAVVMTVVFYPLYHYLHRYIRWKSLASLITVFITLVLIAGPFSYLIVNLVNELRDFINYLNTKGVSRLDDLLKSQQILWLQEKIKTTFNLHEFNIGEMLSESISKLSKSILSNVTRGVANIMAVVVNFLLMLFAMFFMIKDGPDFIKKIRDYMPFSDAQKDRLASQIKDMVISTIYGGVVVALIQGALGGITFFLLGLNSPVLLGTLMAFMSFIPGLGAVSVWGPVLVFFLIKKFYIKAIILFLVGTFVISMVDNILKPIIISGRTRMPTMVIFFCVIGGLKVFGLIGLVLGPLVVALFVSVLEIFRSIDANPKSLP
ncbi:MAG: AI-2E family transporter [Nitrospirae bacterium]|nr:MAG: AI-2E family transporter [Nitrospirota bacterium]